MNDWMEVFAAGEHVSTSGAKRKWTVADLQHMADAYDPEKHEAPMVVGHPADNDPAYGWVKALRVDGTKLLALPGQVAPEFAEWVKSGRYKKRSISIYPDGTLRHVGFLGAKPPAVKGLRDIEFAAPAAEIYEYADEEDANMNEVEQLKRQLAESEAKRQAAESDAAKARQEKEQAAADFAELEQKTKKQAIVDFVEQGIKDAKILPAWKDRGLVEFMAALDGGTETYEFSEGKKETSLEWFKGFISSFAEHRLFKDLAKPQGGEKKHDDFAEDEALGKEIAAKVAPPQA